MDELCRKAIAVLEASDARFYIDMTEALKTGRAVAVIAEEDGVLLICKKSDNSSMVKKYVNEVRIKYGDEFV